MGTYKSGLVVVVDDSALLVVEGDSGVPAEHLSEFLAGDSAAVVEHVSQCSEGGSAVVVKDFSAVVEHGRASSGERAVADFVVE